MLKKIIILPLMAFTLVTLTAAVKPGNNMEAPTDLDSGEVVFNFYESNFIRDAATIDNADFDEENRIYDFEITNETDPELPVRVYKGDSEDIEEMGSIEVGDDTDRGDSDLDALADDNNLELTEEIEPGDTQSFTLDINEAIIGFVYFEGSWQYHDDNIALVNEYAVPFLEQFGGALSTIVSAGSSVFVATFEGLLDVFWDADANDGDGALNWIAYVTVLPVGFSLVRWAFRKIFNLIQQRM